VTSEAPLPGRVVRLDARGCLVLLDDPALGADAKRRLWCSVRGRIHLRDRAAQRTPLAVGDRVEVERTTEGRGAVVRALPRTSMLSRPSIRDTRTEHVLAANVDRGVIVTSAREPDFHPGLVDRILAVLAWSRLEALLVVNKADLAEDAPPEVAAYEAIGVPVVLTSAVTGRGVEALRARLSRGASVVTGHSGVGKTSLLNALAPGLGLVVGEVNPVTRRGTHTTTAAVWIPFGEGALVDTAGVREFGLWGVPPRDVGWLFADLAKVAPGCRYPDCTHVSEPACAVREAVEGGEIAAFRYDSYLRILGSLASPEA
jgi:ribosome biogenesis GTPase